ncbi:hypothetical protein [Streptomyces sp. DSM 40484]|uniref:hypothetical protein n=1 Tax=Streptomyces kroppenstedtii TaxID=3051181 RepID=UPI0028D62FE9|nr:hypothetical protein [Streptomyces sp. DSM 40484]
MSADLLASHDIPAHDSDRIPVGEYETKELIPKLVISYQSKGWVTKGDVQWVVSRPVMEDGSVRVVVFVENYSAHDVTVNVHQDNRGR